MNEIERPRLEGSVAVSGGRRLSFCGIRNPARRSDHLDARDTGRPTLVFLTSWAVIHMRQWKLQVPALARRFRVLTVEGRGNGAADRPIGPAAYADEEYVADAVAAWTRPASSGLCSWGCRWAPAMRCSSRPIIPAGSPAWWRPRPRCP